MIRLEGFTEFFQHSGNRLCAHPNYRGNWEWYDWIMIEFEEDWCLDNTNNVDEGLDPLPRGQFPFNCFPSKILGIFQSLAANEGELMIIVHPCLHIF
jgi:hypothetical protein